MTLLTPRPIRDVIRDLADDTSGDATIRLQHFRDLEASVEHLLRDVDEHHHEALSERVGLGVDVLTMMRLINDLKQAFQRDIVALREENMRLQADIAGVRAECQTLSAAQTPEALEQRLRTLEGRRRTSDPMERAESVRETIAALERVRQEAEQESLQQIAAKTQQRLLDVLEAVAVLRAELGTTREELAQMKEATNE